MTMMDSPCTACSSNHDVTIIVIIFAVLPVKLPVTQNAPRRDTPRISASTAVAFETLICRLISVDYCQPRQLVYTATGDTACGQCIPVSRYRVLNIH